MTDEEVKIKDLQKQVTVLEQKLRLFELPGDTRAYYSLQRTLNQQADFLNNFDFTKEIKATVTKDDKLYDRASDLWDKMPVNISRVTALKTELGITGNEEKDTAKKASFLDKNV